MMHFEEGFLLVDKELAEEGRAVRKKTERISEYQDEGSDAKPSDV